jgi:hypothetical protein
MKMTFQEIRIIASGPCIANQLRFNFTYRYIDDVLSINNSRFAEFLPLIYPPELEVKETTDTASSASFFAMTAILNPKWSLNYQNPPIWTKFGFQVDYDVVN